jgi:hypothetical protein
MMRLRSCVGPAASGLVLVAAACYSQAPTPVLPAPVITQPKCGAVVVWPDGLFTLAWERLDSASSYTVEVDCLSCGDGRDAWSSQSGTPWHVTPGLQLPTYRTDVVSRLRREGGRTMRWRVWAVDRQGADGGKSEWCVVAFSQDGLPTPSSGVPKPDSR